MSAAETHTPLDELDLLADVLGDQTRRGIFLFVTESDEPVTAGDVGDAFDIHRTVARGHLEKLVESGLLESRSRRRPEGGRPPKVYSRSRRRLEVSLPARQYELLAELLLESLERFGSAAEMVLREVGRAHGRRLAALASDQTPEGLLAPLREAGARMSVEEQGDGFEVSVPECLFRELSAARPGLVCTLDRAVMEGMLNAGPTAYRMVEAHRRHERHDVCRVRFVPDGDAAHAHAEA